MTQPTLADGFRLMTLEERWERFEKEHPDHLKSFIRRGALADLGAELRPTLFNCDIDEVITREYPGLTYNSSYVAMTAVEIISYIKAHHQKLGQIIETLSLKHTRGAYLSKRSVLHFCEQTHMVGRQETGNLQTRALELHDCVAIQVKIT